MINKSIITIGTVIQNKVNQFTTKCFMARWKLHFRLRNMILICALIYNIVD